MPNRIIREGILTSAAINSLSDDGEIFYRRLMSVVDDSGRYEVDLDMLRIYLFPRKLEAWPVERVRAALLECCEIEAGPNGEKLIKQYRVNGKNYLELWKFGQRVRSEKYPAPGSEFVTSADIGEQMTVTCQVSAAPATHSHSPTTSHSHSTEVLSLEEIETAADWSEEIYSKHPKQAYRDLALLALKKIYDKPADRSLWDLHYEAWLDHWARDGLKYCPPLVRPDGSGFVPDGAWRKPPPSVRALIPQKGNAVLRVLERSTHDIAG